MNATTPAIDRREKTALLDIIAQRIEQRAHLKSELGVDLRDLLGLPDLADLSRGLEILRREVALHASREAPT